MTDAEMEDPVRLARDPLAIVRELARQRDHARVWSAFWQSQKADFRAALPDLPREASDGWSAVKEAR